MHELPVLESILDTVLAHARKHGVRRVAAIHLDVGELSDLEDEWMQRYLDYLGKGSIAQGARLVIRRVPLKGRCGACGEAFPICGAGEGPVRCPACGGERFDLVEGKGYFIRSMEAI